MDVTAQFAEAAAWGAGLVMGVAGHIALVFFAVTAIVGAYKDATRVG